MAATATAGNQAMATLTQAIDAANKVTKLDTLSAENLATAKEYVKNKVFPQLSHPPDFDTAIEDLVNYPAFNSLSDASKNAYKDKIDEAAGAGTGKKKRAEHCHELPTRSKA